MAWGVDRWGQNAGQTISFGKFVTAGSVSPTNTIARLLEQFKTISNSLSFGSGEAYVYLIDTAGYYHGFPDPTTNAHDQVSTDYTQTGSTTSYTTGAAASTVWS